MLSFLIPLDLFWVVFRSGSPKCFGTLWPNIWGIFSTMKKICAILTKTAYMIPNHAWTFYRPKYFEDSNSPPFFLIFVIWIFTGGKEIIYFYSGWCTIKYTKYKQNTNLERFFIEAVVEDLLNLILILHESFLTYAIPQESWLNRYNHCSDRKSFLTHRRSTPRLHGFHTACPFI